MHLSKDEELRQIQRWLLITSILDLPGVILMGLGLYAVFGTDRSALPDIFYNQSIAFGAILMGGAIMAWALFKMVSLLKRRSEILTTGNA